MDSKVSQPHIWVAFYLYAPNYSGAAVQFDGTLKYLTHRGFRVTVLASAEHAASHLAGQTVEVDGIPVRYMPVFQRRDWSKIRPHLPQTALSYANSLVSFYTFSKRVARVLKEEMRPGDVLFLGSLGSFSYLCIEQAQRSGAASLVQLTLIGSDDPLAFQGKPDGFLKRRAFDKADRLVCISTALAESCLQAGIPEEKILRLPNGVDTSQCRPLSPDERSALRRKLDWSDQKRYLIFVGAALARKGIDIVARAFIHAAGQRPDLELVVIGPYDFSDRSRHEPARQLLVSDLQAEIEQAGLAQRVHWTGYVEPERLPEYLQAADLFIFPSRREGLPNVVTMAAACGLPCIAARLEGIITDILPTEAEGWLISDYNAETYSQAILSLLAQPERALAMGQAAHRWTSAQFDLQQINQSYAGLFQELARARPALNEYA